MHKPFEVLEKWQGRWVTRKGPLSDIMCRHWSLGWGRSGSTLRRTFRIVSPLRAHLARQPVPLRRKKSEVVYVGIDRKKQIHWDRRQVVLGVAPCMARCIRIVSVVKANPTVDQTSDNERLKCRPDQIFCCDRQSQELELDRLAKRLDDPVGARRKRVLFFLFPAS